jgi:hypothetical protein
MMAVSRGSASLGYPQQGCEFAPHAAGVRCLECAAEPVRAPRGASLSIARAFLEVR